MRTLFLAAGLLAGFLANAQQAPTEQFKIACVGFYNFENLFDTLDSPDTDDAQFLPEGEYKYTAKIYWEKQDHLSDVISQLGSDLTPDGPAILGVAEIENRTVLEDFVKNPRLAKRRYQIVHFDSPDDRGVDVALLYNPKYFKVTNAKPVRSDLTALGGRDTRDILLVSGVFDGDPLHVMVNHWPSRRGGEETTRPFRDKCAAICKALADSILQVDPTAKIIVMGDLNDDPVNNSVLEVLGAKQKTKQVAPGGFYNPWIDFYKKGIGTMAYRDAWSLFDQIILSYNFLPEKQSGYRFYQARVFNRPFLLQKSGNFKGYPYRTYVGSQYMGGYSDHLPTCVYLLKPFKP
jgi:hypothetical protein